MFVIGFIARLGCIEGQEELVECLLETSVCSSNFCIRFKAPETCVPTVLSTNDCALVRSFTLFVKSVILSNAFSS